MHSGKVSPDEVQLTEDPEKGGEEPTEKTRILGGKFRDKLGQMSGVHQGMVDYLNPYEQEILERNKPKVKLTEYLISSIRL